MENSIKVILFSKYSRLGASSRLRSLQYLPELQKSGISVDVYPLFDNNYLELLYQNSTRSPLNIIKSYLRRFSRLVSVFQYDLVWIEKELFPYFPAWFEQLMRVFNIKYIVDYDDAVFHNYDLSDNKYIRALLGKKIDKVMASATCVIAGNKYLQDRAVNAGAKLIELIPTVLDYSRYQPSDPTLMKELIIGWIGSPSTQHYILSLKPVLETICKEGACKLMLVGAHISLLEDLKNINVEILPWSESTEAGYIAMFDIGIMPLSDGPWEKGKCGYKLIQYMACAKPVVASSVGVNVKIIEETQCGLLAENQSTWLESLNLLVDDESLRLSAGSKGRLAVERIYSLQVQASNIAHLIKRVV